MSMKETSKFIALILRHKPEEIGITLDEHGWANVDELIAGISKRQPFSMADLEEIVAADEKGRYSFNEDKTLILDVIYSSWKRLSSTLRTNPPASVFKRWKST